MKLLNSVNGFIPILLLAGLILTSSVAVGGAIYALKIQQTQSPTELESQTAIPTSPSKKKLKSNKPSASNTTNVVDTRNWQTYSKPFFDYTFKYPANGYRIDEQEGAYATARFCDDSYKFTRNCGVPAPEEFKVEIVNLKPGQNLVGWLEEAQKHHKSSVLYKQAEFIWKDKRNKKEWTKYQGFKAYHLDIVYDKEFLDNYAPFKITQEMLDDQKGSITWVAYANNTPLKMDYYYFIKGSKVYTISKITSNKSKTEIDAIFNTFTFLN